jgi:phosphate:Na+ symporter
MKGSVENFADKFDLNQFPNISLWFYVLVGTLVTAVMQASAATIAIVLTALNSQLITFDMGIAMVIGANVGTTITVLIGAIGGVPAKKRVALSHLIFNLVTGILAFISIPILVRIINIFLNVQSSSLMGLALFHTLFNVLGVAIFFPFVGLFSRMLVKLYPDFKPVLTIYIDQTPTEVLDAATDALRKEIVHLLQECQLYNLQLLRIDTKLVFDDDTPLEKNLKKKFTLDDLYASIKLLHAEIFTYYSRIQNQKLNETEAKELERLIFASRNIMNALKNFKGVRHNMDEFDGSDNLFLNSQYKLFRKRLLELYHNMSRIFQLEDKEEQYRSLLAAFSQVEKADNTFIKNISKAVSRHNIQEIDIASLLLVNRLFTQSCRMQIYCLKDLLLSLELINSFDRALDVNAVRAEEQSEGQLK